MQAKREVQEESKEAVPLCVDLDGTLLLTDMLYESILCLIKQNPLYLVLFPVWLFSGKANLKAQIAKRAQFYGIAPPFNEQVVNFILKARRTQPIILVTGSNQRIAEIPEIQDKYFDKVFGSDDLVNLTAENKRRFLVNKYGAAGYDYIGNDVDDIPVWASARKSFVVSEPGGIENKAGIEFSGVFTAIKPTFSDFFKLIRVHQWTKNGLVFVPLVLEHRLLDFKAEILVILSFFAMCFLASATYVINDMLDLNADRQNETKRSRVLASGKVPLRHGFYVIVGLMCLASFLTLFLPAQMNLLLFTYLICTLAYSFILKQKAIIDVLCIALLHTLRVVAGTVVISAQWSFWLLAFSVFIFYSLATAKRVAELTNLKTLGKFHTVGRDYRITDIPILIASGVATGYISILIVALYINSEKSFQQYGEPSFLWLLCPVLMYWIGRLWLITSRGELHEDPIVFAMRDRVSIFTSAIIATIVIMAAFTRLN